MSFRPLYSNMSLISRLEGFQFQFSKAASHTVVSRYKPSCMVCTLSNFFRPLQSGSQTKNCLHQTFISCFFHILGTRKQSLSKETKGSVGLSANIADMCIIPFQIITNCYTKVLNAFNILKKCTPWALVYMKIKALQACNIPRHWIFCNKIFLSKSVHLLK